MLLPRGNNRQVIFAGDGDMKAYVTWLKEYGDKFYVAVHAWVLMTNHVKASGVKSIKGQVLSFAQHTRPAPTLSHSFNPFIIIKMARWLVSATILFHDILKTFLIV